MRATFATHFGELRRRLVVVMVFFMVAFGLLYGDKELLLNGLTQPLLEVLPNNHSLVYTSVGELFFTYVKICALGAFALTLPVLLWQLWRFAAPGLYDKEKSRIRPYLWIVPGLFYGGCMFAFMLILPLALQFFFGFTDVSVFPMTSIKEYLSFVLNLLLAFGLCFELPAILVFLMQVGLLKVQTLVQNRRIAIVLVFVAAAVLTPPDPLSQTMLAIPMLALYEAAILIGKRIKK